MSEFARVLSLESQAIRAAISCLAVTYDDAIPYLVCRSPVLFSGMGKSGLIAQKAASTFRSLGVPSHYVHPGDASHGDMGAVHGDAVVVLLSNSGETSELADMIFFCRAEKVPIISITANPSNTLARAAHVMLVYGEHPEACPNGLAPTTSTTVMLAVCDALAVDVAKEKGVTPTDFRRYHPGGKLGMRLRTARDLMKTDLPLVNLRSPVSEVILAMTGSVPGIAVVMGPTGCEGVVTDGDLRRGFDSVGDALTRFKAKDIMSPSPVTAPEQATAQDLAALMNERRVTKVLIEDALGAIVGVVNLHDVLTA